MISIDYNLAFELKKAGFPGSEYWLDIEMKEGVPDGRPLVTLEELIEACGDRFKGLVYGESQTVGEPWGAYTILNGDEFGLSYPDTEGKTPSEAVAKLWLSINKK